MNLPFELYVALRYLLAGRKQAFISLISLISIGGVTVGVAALIIVLALMTGLQGELRSRIVGSAAQVYVWKLGEGGIDDYVAEAAKLHKLRHITGAAPAVVGKALVTSGAGEAFITIKGIDPELEKTVTDIERSIQKGSLKALVSSNPDEVDGILIGSDLASQLGAYVGDSITVLTPEGTLTPMGPMPRTRRFRVVGLFSLGLYEFDSSYGFVSLDVAKRLLDKSKVDFIQLRVDDIFAAPQIADDIIQQLGKDYSATDWQDMNRSLFSALWLEKFAISTTIGLIVMVAALNIVASLVLLVMEKSRDIAILKTMGAAPRSVMTVFMLQGLIIGVVGTTLGASLGYGIASFLDRYRIIRLPMDVYQVSYVPFVIQVFDFAVVVISAVLICFLATLYPSRQASRLDPVQALRYQ